MIPFSLAGQVSRQDVVKYRKFAARYDTFTSYKQIEWHHKIYKNGDKIKTKDTRPSNVIGVIEKFLTPYKRSDDTFDGSPGFFQMLQLPEEIYGTGPDARKIYHVSKINRDVSEDDIKKEINSLLEKLPANIELFFPRGFAVLEGSRIPAGQPIGDVQAVIKDGKGEKMNGKVNLKSVRKNLNLQMDIRHFSECQFIARIFFYIIINTILYIILLYIILYKVELQHDFSLKYH